jgi:hypothetical protein
VTADSLVRSSGRATTSGRLVVAIPFKQSELAGLIHQGDQVALIVSDSYGETVILTDVIVVGLPETSSGGLLGGSSSGSVLVDVREADAALLAGVGSTASVTIALL